MKKRQTFWVMLVLLFPAGAFCQLDKGAYLNSASIGLAYQNSNYSTAGGSVKYNSLDFNLNDNLGVFVIDRLAIGPGLTFDAGSETYKYVSNSSTTGDTKTHQTTYSVFFDPFVRYYFLHKGKSALFGQVSAAIGYGQKFETNTNQYMDEEKTTYKTLLYGGSASFGYVFFITNNIGVETALGYRFTGAESKHNDVSLVTRNSSVTLNAGFAFYIGK
ncbi:MAG: hypothetical protein NTW10_08845 [Bacteroidetes bacterium]|nr:hypothetical protein [Bacteroidota bacterium]